MSHALTEMAGRFKKHALFIITINQPRAGMI
jgi:hypothetical protein